MGPRIVEIFGDVSEEDIIGRVGGIVEFEVTSILVESIFGYRHRRSSDIVILGLDAGFRFDARFGFDSRSGHVDEQVRSKATLVGIQCQAKWCNLIYRSVVLFFNRTGLLQPNAFVAT